MGNVNKSIFYNSGNWYKGNLHSHTTRSDGKLDPEQMALEYQKRGYNFISYTDHLLYSNDESKNTADFIYIPGTEVHFLHPRLHVHVTFFPGTDCQIKNAAGRLFDNGTKLPLHDTNGDLGVIQKFMDDMHSRGYISFLTHPIWSYMEPEEAVSLSGFTGVEVFNGSSEVFSHVGNASAIWDSFLRRGIGIWGIAADDNHNFYPIDGSQCDSFRGWIMVKASALTRNDIMKAIADGSFYATTGPEIYDFETDGEYVRVTCSPVDRIYFMAGKGRGKYKLGTAGENELTEFIYKLKGDERYIRAECIDSRGNTAFSNPIFLG